MPVYCKKGKPRYRSRKIKAGRQRLAFCNNRVVEITTYKKGKRPRKKRIKVEKLERVRL